MRKSFLFPFLGKIKRYFRLSPFLAEYSHHYKITVFKPTAKCRTGGINILSGSKRPGICQYLSPYILRASVVHLRMKSVFASV